jgi:GT2 family glycosyltransferase
MARSVIPSKKTALIVLGMHRSGTSAMARVLSLAGAELPTRLMKEMPDNPTGFWEPIDVVAMSDKIMASFDTTWDDVFAGVKNPHLDEAHPELLAEAVDLLKANFGDASPIVIKDPRVAVLGGFWRRALEAAGYEPRYVIMVRNPLEVAASLTARNGFSREKALMLWSGYMIASERDTRDAPRVFVRYESLLADWRSTLDQIEGQLGISLPRRTPASSVETDRFLKSSLRHHVQDIPLGEQKSLWAPVKTLHDWFTAAADGHAKPNVAPGEIESELASLKTLFGPIMAETQLELRALAELRQREAQAAQADGEIARAVIETLEIAVADLQSRQERQEIEGVQQAEASAARVADLKLQIEQAAKSEALLADQLAEHAAAQRELTDALSQRDAALLAQDEASAARVADLMLQAEQAAKSEALLADQLAEHAAAQRELADALSQRDAALLAQDEASAARVADLMLQAEQAAKSEALLADQLAEHAAAQRELADALSQRDAALLAQDEASAARVADLMLQAEQAAKSEALLADQLAEHAAAQRELADALSQRDAALLAQDEALQHVQGLLTVTSGELNDVKAAANTVAEDLNLARRNEVALASRLDHAREAEALAGRQAEALSTALEAQQRQATALDEALRTANRQFAAAQRSGDETSRALRGELQNQVALIEELRMAAALESRNLKRHLHEQTEALRGLTSRHESLAGDYARLSNSTSWRMTAPLRTLLGQNQAAATVLRNGAKLAYWTVTLQLPRRLRLRREFLARQASPSPLAVAAASEALTVADGDVASPPTPSAAAATAAVAVAVAAPAAEPAARVFDWPVAHRPHTPDEVLGLYDRRADDATPREAERGRIFLERFDLLSDRPRFEEAVAYINAKPRTALAPNSAAKPAVSVIVPIYGQLAYTLNCLDSLLDHPARASFEILIGDDLSPDRSRELLPLIDGVNLVQHAENGGFIVNCNATAAKARGDYLLFLNNDTRVAAGWLDELVDSFTHFPKAGLVGSKLFYPDGALQESGGIIWRDGSAWNYGRDQDPNRPEFCYARQVDYVSGASILVPRDLWDSLGGFDEHYRPAYCEDADLALRIRAADREVWLQPLSRVIHYEGRTSGTDLTKGVKAYQTINMEKLFARWEPALAAHRPNAEMPLLEKDRNVSKRALVIDVGTPTPDQDAGSVVTMATIKIYQDLGYKVTFLPRDNFLFDPVYTAALQRLGVECIYAPYDVDFAVFMARQGAQFDVIQVFRIDVAEKCLPDLRRHAPSAPVIFHNVDLHYLRMSRQAELGKDPELRLAAEQMKVRELDLLKRVDCTIVTSPVEEEILRRENPDANILVFPYMIDVVGTSVGFTPRRDLMFLGGYRHTPNVDAAEWFVDEIWPKLANRLPEANLLIAGASPTESIKALASDRIDVTGMIPDLGPIFDQTRVFVAPIRYGAGIKGKVATAMAHGVPVVATSCAAEGMFLENERDLLIVDDPDTFAEHVFTLYTDPEAWAKFSRNGQDFVIEHNSMIKGRGAILRAIALASSIKT